MECGCEVQGYRDERCVGRGMCGKDTTYDTACSLARGFFCGDCNNAEADKLKCIEDGCASLRHAIHEELVLARTHALSSAQQTGVAPTDKPKT